ncbi:hypothetical protein AAFF_G00078400 [Aldrovandia affinis]|uniref:Uncharacterized protein n=1 Tax=Aldrovandia affinis TaxID=143900 RepID=A0AAD7VXM8_9TELE|nr:hypothetical protein AAFF_G00078400 [Aldrovandia affinis]
MFTPHRFCSLELVGNAANRSNTYVANATGKPLRIYYSAGRLGLEMVNVNAGSLSVFKLHSQYRYVRIPVGSFVQIAGQGAIYVFHRD